MLLMLSVFATFVVAMFLLLSSFLDCFFNLIFFSFVVMLFGFCLFFSWSLIYFLVLVLFFFLSWFFFSSFPFFSFLLLSFVVFSFSLLLFSFCMQFLFISFLIGLYISAISSYLKHWIGSKPGSCKWPKTGVFKEGILNSPHWASILYTCHVYYIYIYTHCRYTSFNWEWQYLNQYLNMAKRTSFEGRHQMITSNLPYVFFSVETKDQPVFLR